jgi:hypothetical protein
VLLQLARALAVCHVEHGVVHRDVKPGNVLIASDGSPKLIDFGLGNLEAQAESLTDVTQSLIGTPAYLSPEQIDQGRTLASPQSDQFSFGALCYELLTLEGAFVRETRSETLDAVSRAAPTPLRRVNPEVPDDLERIVLHALERSPEERYPDLQALADDLEAFLDHRAISLRAPSLARRARGWLRRNPASVRTAALAAGGGLIVAVLGFAAVDHARDRTDLRSRLVDFSAAIPELKEPDDFTTAYVPLQLAAQRAAELDRHFLGSFADALSDDVQSVAQELSARVARRMEDTEPRPFAKGPAALESKRGMWSAAWRDVVALEEATCPECTENLSNRLRGTLELPTSPEGGTFELQRHVGQGLMEGSQASNAFADVLRVDRTDRDASELHRVTLRDRDGAVVAETELVVHPADERTIVEPRPIDPVILSDMLDVPETSVAFAYESGRDRQVRVFKIARRLVTWNDVLRVDPDYARTLMRRVPDSDHNGDAPAQLTFMNALELARRFGARLPTGPELIAAAQQVELVPGDERTGGEYIADQYLLTGMIAIGYRCPGPEAPATCIAGPSSERGLMPILVSYKPDELAHGPGGKPIAVRLAYSR